MKAVNLSEDQLRIEAVKQLQILDTESEPEFDEVVKFVGALCETPYVVLTMVDTDRLWFKSKLGLSICEVEREISMCNHTLEQNKKLEIEDARLHPVFKDNPLVNSDLNIRFYTGIPLILEDNVTVGTLCVLDDKPRILNDTQKVGIELMAKQIVHLLESRRDKIRAENEAIRTQSLATKFTSLYNSIEDGVVENTVPNGRFTDCNEAFCKMLGYSQQELLQLSVFDITPQSHHELSKVKLQDVMTPQGETEAFEKQYLHKEGHIVPALTKVFRIQTAPDEMPKVWAQIKDLSQQKQKEQKRAQRKKMESLGTLSGGIAHDFNNILAIISGSAELIKLENQSTIIDNYLEKIAEGSKRGAELVNRILAFSHKSQKPAKAIDLKTAIEQSLRLITPTIPKTIALHLNLEQSGVIRADESNITQILINLCNNACQAIEPGSGAISLTLKPCEQNLIELVVTDDGNGMDEEQLGQIFDPFYTTHDKGRGTGLGLAIVHGLVEEMQGSIGVESSPGLGTTFHIQLPLTETNTSASQDQRTADYTTESDNLSAAKNSARVLVVEDEKDIAQLYKEALEADGHSVHIEHDGLKGLEVIESAIESFDILVTDDQMPGLRGIDLAKQLRMRSPDTPIVLLTGFVSPLVENAEENGEINACLAKPVSLKMFRKTVNRLLEQTA